MGVNSCIGPRMHKFVAFYLPLLAIAVSCNESQTPTYQWTDDETGESVTCEKCPPGTYAKRHCSKSRSTECEGCPQSYYTELWNYVERCMYCDYYCSADQIETAPCTSKQNRECECKKGYHQKFGFCIRHSACPPGEGVVLNGTIHNNVKCAPCSEGSFSSESSSTQACLNHSACAATKTAVPGNDKHDTFCTACKTNGSAPEDQAVCDLDALKFVLQQDLKPRAQKRLFREARRKARGNGENATLEKLLQAIQQERKPFVRVLLEILERGRLLHLRNKVRKWFSVRSDT